MENWWGNIWRRIAGWINDKGTQKVKLTRGTKDGSTAADYNTTGSGYKTISGATPAGTFGVTFPSVRQSPLAGSQMRQVARLLHLSVTPCGSTIIKLITRVSAAAGTVTFQWVPSACTWPMRRLLPVRTLARPSLVNRLRPRRGLENLGSPGERWLLEHGR